MYLLFMYFTFFNFIFNSELNICKLVYLIIESLKFAYIIE